LFLHFIMRYNVYLATEYSSIVFLKSKLMAF
jgi:hypothetical protein